jgi:SagB-type dehydrogenase family enzyme
MTTTVTGVETLFSFHPELRVREEGPDLLIVHGWHVTRLNAPGAGLRAGIQRLVDGPVPMDDVVSAVLAGGSGADGVTELARLHRLMVRVNAAVVRTLVDGDRRLLSVVPQTRTARFDLMPPPIGPVRLCRFAHLHRHGGAWVVESPLSEFRVELAAPGVLGIVTALAETATVADLMVSTGDLAPSVVAHLVAARIVVTGAQDDPALDQWSYHDLLFHARNRRGRPDEPLVTAPATVPPRPGRRVPLHRPKLDALRDPSFTAVLESRRSLRAFGDQPMTAEQAGEFLYRAARLRAVSPSGSTFGYEAADRPYPTAGSVGDLELYLTVHRVQGLERGIYHYDSARHQLVLLNEEPQAADMLLNVSAAQYGRPDLLLTVTSRFARNGHAYAATLQHVGALYQTLYLVATAMGLAPCALNGGDADIAAYALGLDWVKESAVGAFMLGSRPPVTPHRPGRRPVNDADWAG